MKRHSKLRSALLATLLLSTAAGACNARGEASAPKALATDSSGYAAVATAAPEPPRAATPAGLLPGMYAETGAVTDVASAARSARPIPRATDGRKIVRTGELQIRVDDYEPARKQIDELLRASGGFIANAQVGHSDGRVTEATLVLRVPTDGYEDLVARLAVLGTVVSESSSAEDVTDQWVDVNARLANAKKLEGRLVELIATQAGNVTQLLEVERELARVREQIELFEGRLHVLEDQTSLSTLTLRVQTRAPYQAAITPTFGGDAGRALHASWASVTGLARDLALGGIGLLPWLPLAAIGFWLARRYGRRLKRRVLGPAGTSVGPST